jgi:hypothetical protein
MVTLAALVNDNPKLSFSVNKFLTLTEDERQQVVSRHDVFVFKCEEGAGACDASGHLFILLEKGIR